MAHNCRHSLVYLGLWGHAILILVQKEMQGEVLIDWTFLFLIVAFELWGYVDVCAPCLQWDGHWAWSEDHCAAMTIGPGGSYGVDVVINLFICYNSSQVLFCFFFFAFSL